MAPSASKTEPTKIPTVDLSPFSEINSKSFTDADRLKAGQALVAACHDLGFVKIVGHGLSKEEIDEALAWVKKFYDLPLEEKMKAPHPPGFMPHRGYSGVSKEKVLELEEDAPSRAVLPNGKEPVRKITDYKESYEIGSEHDDQQQNIWLPEDVLPGFRSYMTSLYERLAGVSRVVLSAMDVGLGLSGDDSAALQQLASDTHCQLRLLHYPPISKALLQNTLFTRLPAHADWGAFTILFQDSRGGLELRDPRSKEFIHAKPSEDGALILNIADMLQRFTNDYFVSALHRVSVPHPDDVPGSGIPARYSVPFFVAPAPAHTVATLARFVTPDRPAKYEPVRWEEYPSIAGNKMYEA